MNLRRSKKKEREGRKDVSIIPIHEILKNIDKS